MDIAARKELEQYATTLSDKYRGREFLYSGDGHNELRGHRWMFNTAFIDRETNMPLVRLDAKGKAAERDGVQYEQHVYVKVSPAFFFEYFTEYRRQNIVAEEKPTCAPPPGQPKGCCEIPKGTLKTPNAKTRKAKPINATNREIEEWFRNRNELERNGWTESEIRKRIMSDRNDKIERNPTNSHSVWVNVHPWRQDARDYEFPWLDDISRYFLHNLLNGRHPFGL